MEPHRKAIRLDRTGYQGVIDLLGGLVDGVVAVGSHLVIRLLEPELVSNTNLTIALALRHLVEQLDGVAVLLRVGCSEPAKIVMRAAFEAALNLAYMIEADSDRRTLCYRLGNLHRRLNLIESFDPTTEAGRVARDGVGADTSGFRIGSHDTTKGAAELRSKIALPVYAEAEAERQRLGRRAKWYSLFGGPVNLRQLATRVGMGAQYELLYREWSGAAHAEALMEKIKVVDKETRVPAMRDPSDLQVLTSIAVSTGIASYRKTIQALVPADMDGFKAWYVQEVADLYRRVSETEPMIRAGDDESETAAG